MVSSKKSSSAFTLVELVVVVIIAGVIATLAGVQFQRTMSIQEYHRVRVNMIAIHSACLIYKTKNGHYPNNGIAASGYVYSLQMDKFWADIGYTPADAADRNYSYYYDDLPADGYTNIRAGISVPWMGDVPATVWTWLAKSIHEDSDPTKNNPECEDGIGIPIPCP